MVQNLGKFDVAIIGGGPGGYVAAIRGAQLGLKVAVVEKDPKPGGTCLHRGCIPTKALLQSANVFDTARSTEEFGVFVENPRLDLGAVSKYKDRVVLKNAMGVESLLKKNKVTLIQGQGRLESATKVRVKPASGDEAELETRHLVLATGSVPTRLPFLDFKDPRIVTSDELLRMQTLPKHATVLGAGAVGVEFASILRSFGCEVLLVEMLDRLLPNEDADISAELARAFRKRKIDCRTATRLEKAQATEGGIELSLTPQGGAAEKLTTGLLLCAVGRSPYTEGLNAGKLGVEFERGFAKVNKFRQTSVKNIYAIGDLVGDTPLLAHVAMAEGILAMETIAGKNPQPINPARIPSATYCDPEVASVGLTEEKAKTLGYKVKTSKFPFQALGKAGILRATGGMFKLVAEEKYDEILGVHLIGPHATDLIAEACMALGLEATAHDIAHVIHAHPTLSEGMLEAAHGLLGGAIHI